MRANLFVLFVIENSNIVTQWAYTHPNHKVVYPIQPKRVVGATRICDWNAQNVKDNVSKGDWEYDYDFTPWTLTSDDYILAINLKWDNFTTDSDGDWFSFICF